MPCLLRDACEWCGRPAALPPRWVWGRGWVGPLALLLAQAPHTALLTGPPSSACSHLFWHPAHLSIAAHTLGVQASAAIMRVLAQAPPPCRLGHQLARVLSAQRTSLLLHLPVGAGLCRDHARAGGPCAGRGFREGEH